MTTNDTNDTTTIDCTDLSTDAAVIAQLSQQAVLPRQLTDGQLYAIQAADGSTTLLETPGYLRDVEDSRADRPRRIERAVTVRDADSLCDHLNRNLSSAFPSCYRHGDGELEVWADLDARKVTAYLDGVGGWRMHTATLALRHSREWVEWTSVDGKLLPQATLAQFIEDHLSSIAEPDGAKLLDVCQTLQATTSVAFKSQTILANGQRQIRYEESVEAKAGQKGDLTIPGELLLALPIFQGGERVVVRARFRFAIRDGVLTLGVKLVEPDREVERAFAEVVDDIQGRIDVRVNHGIG